MLNQLLKILYIAHRIPYPPNKGDKIRSFNEIKHLSSSHKVDLVCLADNINDLKFKSDLEKYCRRVFVQHFKISQAKLRGSINLIRGKAISVGYFYMKKIQQVIDQWLSDTVYDAIICFSSPMAEYLFRSPFLSHCFSKFAQPATRNPQLIMDFCDVDSDKWLQYSQRSKFPLNLIYRIENKRLLEYEKKINRSFDNSIFVSQQEADLFYRLFPEAKNISVIGNGVDHEYFSQPVTRNSQPETLIFTGAIDYWANVDGVLWFCEKIFPIVKDRYPKVQFYIVGSNPNTEIQKLGHNNKSINITGFVEDIRPYYNNADICVIPLRIARGIQNKVLEAMSMGKAVVTTSTAVQSIKATSGIHLLVEDNFDKFAEAVSMLLENHTLRNYLGTNARRFVKSNYNWQKNMKKFDELMGQAEAGRL
jgi:sugar transferase (PEP-CTERM/EpsH1 system associated)